MFNAEITKEEEKLLGEILEKENGWYFSVPGELKRFSSSEIKVTVKWENSYCSIVQIWLHGTELLGYWDLQGCSKLIEKANNLFEKKYNECLINSLNRYLNA